MRPHPPAAGRARRQKRCSVASVQVRQAEIDDIAQLVNLQFEVYPPSRFPPVNRWGASHLEAHQRVFPAGQLVAVAKGRIIGSTTTMITTKERSEAAHSFASITGNARLQAHDPDGDALYGVDLLVSPFFRGMGVARKLYDARFALQARLQLQGFYAGARIPGYAAVAEEMSAEEYLRLVLAGELSDPTLSRQLHVGFEALGVLPGYLSDPQTRDYAVLIRRQLPRVDQSPALLRPLLAPGNVASRTL